MIKVLHATVMHGPNGKREPAEEGVLIVMADHAGEPKPALERAGDILCASEKDEVSTLAGKRTFLESGEAWPGERSPKCIETHASLVFLTAERAWKMKKPVRLHHIDLCTLEARAHFCREEFRLNRELAGDVYRRLVPLVLKADGRYAVGGRGVVADWLIEMRRLPEAEMLDHRLVEGPQPEPQEIERVAEILVRFYSRTRAPPGAGGVYLKRLRTEARTNALHLHSQWDRIGWSGNRDILELGSEILETVGDEILERGERGILVEGHGDLRPEHVCLEDPPVIFDRVEFNHAMRLVDPFEEFNYLGLACAMLGAGWIRETLVSILERARIQPPSPELRNAYGVNRCLTRARLAIDHLLDSEVRTPEKWPAQARSYLDAAVRLNQSGEGL